MALKSVQPSAKFPVARIQKPLRKIRWMMKLQRLELIIVGAAENVIEYAPEQPEFEDGFNVEFKQIFEKFNFREPVEVYKLNAEVLRLELMMLLGPNGCVENGAPSKGLFPLSLIKSLLKQFS
ncbi:unnamed protein product [Brassica rapa]|uniref:Uncharacterized protein n=2 Tax=Brassica TaxID=3705 RepID=A0A8D9DBU9_BRACM|nr:unnamed protein product [Brassica napus]CAG7871299.1 unnamed protein product [Brassica rapa]